MGIQIILTTTILDMNLNDQVCSLSQAEKLKELGIEQRKGIFEWCVFMPDPTGEHHFYAPVYFQEEIEQQLHEWIASAFTVAELGIMLPEESTSWRDGTMWACGEMGTDLYMLGKTQAEAMAKELITLLETKDLTPEECNKRLTA